MRRFLLFIVCGLFLSSFSGFANEPTLHQLEKAALRYGNVDPEEIAHWKTRAKWSPLFPKVYVSYDQKAANQINNSIQDSVSVTSTGVTLGPPESSLNQDNNLNRGFEVRATWDLDTLIFNKELLSLSSEARYRNSMRAQILSELQQTYFERKKLLQREEGNSRDTLSSSTQIQLEELEAKLDSLTGGFFTKTSGDSYEK